MANRIELRGIDALLADIRRKLQSGSDRIESKALRAGGEEIAGAMRDRVNRSGYAYTHLRDDIKVSNVRRKEGTKFVLIGPSRKTAWRGRFLEFGTSKMAARPFAEPGFHEKKGAALQRIAEEFERGLRS